MNAKQKKVFIQTVQEYYAAFGRHDLQWRKTTDPYKIIVSEIMLQQTQVPRVIEKYKEFLQAFPTVKALATAPLQQVLFHWSGLGYNRRAKFLHQMAQTIHREYHDVFPSTAEELLKLPGIGQYTAGAISAFAYNKPMPIIETNIRTVFLHHFFPTPKITSGSSTSLLIDDKALLPLIIETLDQNNPRQWYWALMDYGSHLKASGIKIHRASKQYNKQSAFKGSLREVRGGIIKILTKQSASIAQLQKMLFFEKERIIDAITALLAEKIIEKQGSTYSIVG